MPFVQGIYLRVGIKKMSILSSNKIVDAWMTSRLHWPNNSYALLLQIQINK